jgi:hypothetical protein
MSERRTTRREGKAMIYESNGETKPRCKHCGTIESFHHAANIKRKARAKVRRAGIADAMDSVGMTKVRGNLGGTYWE